ncbi:DUF1345 domain-containing protein [Oryzibacter oryziterrae]|uniref:DUF1345 domain-containing protein n=1 Tax=Oryzibacter oryziterrae TaxID=2766474 RepID=UPI001F3AA187|nr:DUF1345 domain-containing protein [Oryzibacter oryziterrae]
MMTLTPGVTPRRSRIRRAITVLRARPRLISGIVLGFLVYFLLPTSLEPPTRILIGWDTGVCLYLIMTWKMMAGSDVHALRRRAAQHDEGEWTILLLAMSASLVSLVAIGVDLHRAKLAVGGTEIWRVAVSTLTIIVSWFFVHTVMAQHYAHDYYLRENHGRGLEFPEHITEPDYWDFLYVSFTIGAASQTSDVTIASQRIRRVALAHTILSFLFNTTILALGINVGASLL